MKGLGFRKTADAIAAFVKQHGASAPRRAVLCTYDFDPARFEAVVLPELTRRRRWFRTLVLADAASLQKPGVLGQRAAASSYELAPVRVNGYGVFHPKLTVLQAGPRVLVGVGSSNLTAGGLGGNLELMWFASDESAHGRALAASAMAFLDALRTTPHATLPASARRFLERVSPMAATAADGPLLHSLELPLLDQLRAGRPRRVERVHIMSPWHSAVAETDGADPEVIARVGEALGGSPRVHTQGRNGLAPALGKRVDVRILSASSAGEVDDSHEDAAEDAIRRVRRPARLHAKAYLAVGATSATLWFGSANCTQPALCRVAGRGNVELLARLTLDRKALARFERDLDAMFERGTGTLPPAKPPRIAAPGGIVLAGHVDTWRAAPRLEIELLAPSRATRLRLGVTTKRRGTLEITVPAGTTSLRLPVAQTQRLLLDREPPPVLWEHANGRAIPFPISVPCAPVIDDPEGVLDDLLDDFAGRVPHALRGPSRCSEQDAPDTEDGEARDRELDLLTLTAHQGAFDRIAVRVELVRRRLAGAPAARTLCVSTVGRLCLPRPVLRTLLDHLGTRPTAR